MKKHQRMSKWKIITIFIVSIGLLYLGKLVSNYYFIGINTTKSETRGLYVCYPLRKTIEKGDLIAFKLKGKEKEQIANHYKLSNMRLIKHVGALPHEYLYTKEKTIYACPNKTLNHTCRILGICMQFDSNGDSIACQKYNGYEIPDNTYYMQSLHQKNSLDSRYFGVINRESMSHHAHFLFGFDAHSDRKDK